jgi:hypothetical protein
MGCAKGRGFIFELKVDSPVTSRQELFLVEYALSQGISVVLKRMPDHTIAVTRYTLGGRQKVFYKTLQHAMFKILPDVPLAYAERQAPLAPNA